MFFRKIFQLSIISLILGPTACTFYWRSEPITESERYWLDAARRYSSPRFASNMSDTVVLQYLDIWIYNTSPIFEQINAGKGTFITFYGMGEYKFAINTHRGIINGNFFLSSECRTSNPDSIGASSALGRCESYTKTVLCAPLQPTEFYMDNQSYNDCIVFDVNTNSSLNPHGYGEWDGFYQPDSVNTITKYVINKEYGLIYFEFEDGEQYRRLFK